MAEEIIEYINGIKTTTIIEDTSAMADEQLKAERFAICSICELRENDFCKSCSCILSVKLSYINSNCPEGKW